MRRRLTVLFAGGALALGCGGATEEPDAGTPVTLVRVEAMDLREEIETTGQLLAKQHAAIAAEVGGRITGVLADEGAVVEAGQEVLVIDPERRTLELASARARADEAEANLREQQREFRRVRELHQSKVASETQLDQAGTELALARSRLEAARAQLGVAERAVSDATVRAPFAGHVAERFVSPGEYVQPGQQLFELVSLDPIEVEFNVPEVDSGRVAVGQVVEVAVAPLPDETFGATVVFVSPTIDTRTRTLRVKAQVENSDGRLRPGLFARVDLGVAEREDVAMIPEEAILRRADGAVVFRARGARVERLVIETGVHHRGYVEVVRGLVAGDLIVSRGQTWLTDGQVVVPRHPDGTLATGPLPDVAEAAETIP